MPPVFPDPEEANRRFGQVFLSLSGKTTDAQTFRRLAELGFPHAEAHLERQSLATVIDLLADPDSDQIFIDREAALRSLGGVEGMAETITSRQLVTYQTGVDSAAIVFAHSALDAAASELCWVTALLSLEAWEPFIKQKQVSLGDLKERGQDVLITEKVADHLSKLEREPLLARVDQLFRLCRPPDGFQPFNSFRFNRERLESLDRLRHDIVHRNVDHTRFWNVDDDIGFLRQSGLYLWAMVNFRFDARADLRHLAGTGSGEG